MFLSVTRLRVRSLYYLPAFLWMTLRAQRQSVGAPGFGGGRLLVDRRSTYWTLTAWEDEKAMKAFRGSGAHVRVMPKLIEWCDEAAYAHWTTADHSIPEWTEAWEHLVSEGRMSQVSHPSPDHESRRFSKPRLQPLIERKLRPAARSGTSAL
jgi:hypothetical protein